MMKRLFVLFVCVCLPISQVHAQSTASRLGAEVAAVIKAKIAKRGFASNDPRFGAAVTAVGAAVVEIGSAVVVAGTAPAWGSILASAVIAGAVGYGIQALSGWLFNSNGTATYTPSTTSSPSTGGALVAGGAYFTRGNCIAGSPEPCVQDSLSQYPPGSSLGEGWYQGTSGASMYYFRIMKDGSIYGTDSVVYVSSGAPYSCPSGQMYNGSSCVVPAGAPTSSPSTPVTKTVAEAIAGLSDAEKSQPLDPKVVADIADATWRQAAAQPGYAGVPYSMTDPVTSADVVAARAASPTMQPATVGDLGAPISSSSPLGEAAAPAGSVGTGTNPAADQPLQNLGVDPGIGSPSLEATPTGLQIVQPLTSLMPDLRNFQVPAHTASCPRPTFDLFGRQIVMDGQCTLFENVRGELYNAMLVTFLIIALFIVLSA